MSEATRVMTPRTGMLDGDGFLARCELADGTEIALVPQMFGNVMLTRGPASRWTVCAEEWMFEHQEAAIAAYIAITTGLSDAPVGWRRYRGPGGLIKRRQDCSTCGRVLEYGDDDGGVAEPVPACDHGASVD